MIERPEHLEHAVVAPRPKPLSDFLAILGLRGTLQASARGSLKREPDCFQPSLRRLILAREDLGFQVAHRHGATLAPPTQRATPYIICCSPNCVSLHRVPAHRP